MVYCVREQGSEAVHRAQHFSCTMHAGAFLCVCKGVVLMYCYYYYYYCYCVHQTPPSSSLCDMSPANRAELYCTIEHSCLARVRCMKQVEHNPWELLPCKVQAVVTRLQVLLTVVAFQTQYYFRCPVVIATSVWCDSCCTSVFGGALMQYWTLLFCIHHCTFLPNLLRNMAFDTRTAAVPGAARAVALQGGSRS